MLRPDPGFFLLAIGLCNIPFYSMEIKHKLCTEFKMIVGEIGPVEGTQFYLSYLYQHYLAEIIFSTIFFLSAVVMGIEKFDQPLGDAIGLVGNGYLNVF
jgi:hypothetical protein